MFSQAIKDLVFKYRAYLEERENEAIKNPDKIHVDEIASKIATFYERVRNVIDYREEHLLRKSTIGRVLKRRVFLKDFDKKFSEPLIKELIRSGHLPNDFVPEIKINLIQKIIDNLIYFLENWGANSNAKGEDYSNWLVEMAISSIEEALFPPTKDRILAETTFDVIKNDLEVRNAKISEDEKKVQLFIAIQKSLFKVDRDQLQYRLLKFIYPNWGVFETTDLPKINEALPNIKKNIELWLKHPLQKDFLRFMNRQKIVFLLLGDIVFSEKPFDENLEKEIEAAYVARFNKEKGKLNRLAFLSVISFFLSKILVAVAIEIPLDKYLSYSFSLINAAINTTFPPFLMLVIIVFIKMPSSKNFILVKQEFEKVLYENNRRHYVVTAPRKRGWFVPLLMRLVYLLTSGATLYFLVRFLLWLKFSIPSIFIFCIFTSMVIATGVKVYNRSREISLEKEKDTIFKFLIDLIAIPFMVIGQLTISGLSRFNILVIGFNFIIELPLQLFIEFLENFRSFLKSKKEESN